MEITNVNKYVDVVHEQFPELSREDVKRIMVYGWKQILQYVRAGNDVRFGRAKNFVFIGQLPSQALTAFKYYTKKLSARIRYMFRRTKSSWDGYYYFALTDNQYKQYEAQSRKKYKVFTNIKIYKLLEELKIKESFKKYIFRLNEDRTSHFSKFYYELKTDKAELIEVRDILTLDDIIISKNKYKYIKQ